MNKTTAMFRGPLAKTDIPVLTTATGTLSCYRCSYWVFPLLVNPHTSHL